MSSAEEGLWTRCQFLRLSVQCCLRRSGTASLAVCTSQRLACVLLYEAVVDCVPSRRPNLVRRRHILWLWIYLLRTTVAAAIFRLTSSETKVPNVFARCRSSASDWRRLRLLWDIFERRKTPVAHFYRRQICVGREPTDVQHGRMVWGELPVFRPPKMSLFNGWNWQKFRRKKFLQSLTFEGFSVVSSS